MQPSETFKPSLIVIWPIVFSVLFSIGGLVCVSIWTSQKGTSFDWQSNKLAVHVVLAIGFSMCQVVAVQILKWQVNNRLLFHLIFAISACLTITLSMVAIVVSKNEAPSTSHLVSMHSWYGVLSLAVFGVVILVGSVESGTSSSAILLFHRCTAVVSVFLTALAIGTGIQEYESSEALARVFNQIQGIIPNRQFHFNGNTLHWVGLLIALASISIVYSGNLCWWNYA